MDMFDLLRYKMFITIPSISIDDYKAYLKGEIEDIESIMVPRQVVGWHTHHDGLSIAKEVDHRWAVIHTPSGLNLCEPFSEAWQAWFLVEQFAQLEIDWTDSLDGILEYRDEIKLELELWRMFLNLKVEKYELDEIKFPCGGPRTEAAKLVRLPQLKGPDKWAIRHGANCLDKEGDWHLEPLSSSRDEDYIRKNRWDTVEDALLFWCQFLKEMKGVED